MSVHLCHAIGCPTPCPPARLMCPRHWRMVPKPQQGAVYSAYRAGQEISKTPSAAYLHAAAAAVRKVAEAEGIAQDVIAAEVADYKAWADRINARTA